MYQLRYWNQLKEFRTHVLYLQKYAETSEWRDKVFNIFIALASSSSIAAWAVWQKHDILWAAIIASSQVATAIKPFLPYKQRLKAISELNDAIQSLALECEKGWHDVSEGVLTENQIHDKLMDLRDKSLKAEKKFLNNVILPCKQKLLTQAENEADKYFQQNYCG